MTENFHQNPLCELVKFLAPAYQLCIRTPLIKLWANEPECLFSEPFLEWKKNMWSLINCIYGEWKWCINGQNCLGHSQIQRAKNQKKSAIYGNWTVCRQRLKWNVFEISFEWIGSEEKFQKMLNLAFEATTHIWQYTIFTFLEVLCQA